MTQIGTFEKEPGPPLRFVDRSLDPTRSGDILLDTPTAESAGR